MAYKFQKGDAILSGSLTTIGDIDAERDGTDGGTLSADNITLADGVCEIHGTAIGTTSVVLSRTDVDSIIKAQDGTALFSFGVDNGYGKLEFGARDSTGGGTNHTAQVLVDVDQATANNARGRLSMKNAAGSATIEVNTAGQGRISCTSIDASDSSATSIIAGNLTVDDNLTVEGNFDADASVQIEIGSKIFGINHSAGAEADSHLSALEFGNTANSAHGACLAYASGSTDAAVGGVTHILFGKGDTTAAKTASNGLPIRAGQLVGSGAGLTLSSTPSGLISSITTVEKAAGNNLEIKKLNYVGVSSGTVTLPALSSAAAGDELIVKLTNSGASVAITVARHGDDGAATIDGTAASVILRVSGASVRFMKASNSAWVLM